MTIEEIKKAAIDAIGTEVTEKAKNDAIIFLKKVLNENVKPVAQTLVDELKEQAKTESGWCSFRDKYFIPGLIDVTEFVLDKAFTLMINASPSKAEETPATPVVETTTPTTVTPTVEPEVAATTTQP
jgi:pyridoxine 5'-phosphate synthase PdxJ